MSFNAFRRHVAVLRTLDPAEPGLSDLDLLRTALGDARVIGIGEGAHFVHEFALARARLLRFLVEECGVTVLAFELGAAEAAAINPWLAGEIDDIVLPPLTAGLFGHLLRWLRAYNHGRPEPLTIIGIDLPNTLTPRADLDHLAALLGVVDPEAAALLDAVLPTAYEIIGGSAAVSAPRWGALGQARQDALTATLARLSFRLTTMEPLYAERSSPELCAAAGRHLEAARHTDYQLRAMNDLFDGGGLSGDPSLREHYMAATVRRHLAAIDPEARMVVVAHNNHLQKTPVMVDGELIAFPMGYYLARDLGPGYRAVALTHTGGSVPEMAFPAGDSPVGFTVAEVGLPAPRAGTVERALVDAGFGASITVTDLQAPGPALTGIRSQSAEMETDPRAAFDMVVTAPAATLSGPDRSFRA
ncbi:erythromycin esterase family protein [Actinoplanes sp. NPDC051494]|uniref:erythromycin esterase family protein n=1 Tax=Actinoplanes sp. NPDC051494 TaxID=3363907 RepID=UPI00379417D5